MTLDFCWFGLAFELTFMSRVRDGVRTWGVTLGTQRLGCPAYVRSLAVSWASEERR
jgi:hypothetical protein